MGKSHLCADITEEIEKLQIEKKDKIPRVDFELENETLDKKLFEPFLLLPTFILAEIFSNVDISDIMSISLTCKL